MPAEADLIKGLFRASAGLDGWGRVVSARHAWAGFLGSLAGSVQAQRARLLILRQGRVVQDWRIGGQVAMPETDLALMRRGRVYSQVDHPGLADRARPLRSLRWQAGSEVDGLLLLGRDERDFRAVDGVRLSNLLPYLGQAVQDWQTQDEIRSRAALDARLAGRLGAGWLVFSAAGLVLAASDPARRWLAGAEGAPRLRADGWLEFAEPMRAQALQQAVAAVAVAEGSESAAAPSRPLPLAVRPRLEIVLTRGRLSGEEVVLGALRRARAARDLPLADLARAFDISRSQARLAMLLADGLSLAQAGQELGWTLETARSASKQLYARMEVSGQGGVLRRVLTSALWLAMPSEGE
ncbi:MAG: hypothetical protein QM682_09860 [Paracoccus sp. (in: a-proteobacteria)]|uniref:helix-turn-helix transcriptional regulator n=1 Tax=Paracoccus sp. TaxID=267 RepID=UPI0039E49261